MASRALLELVIALKDEAQAGIDKLGGSLTMVGGIAAGAVVAGVVAIGGAALDVAGQVDQATRDIQAQLGLTADEAEELGDVGLEVWQDNWFGSIGEATEAVGLIRQQLGDMADEELRAVAGGVAAIGDTFDQETPAVVQAVKAITENFPGTTEQQALDMIARGFQKGLNASGDFLESITEYSTQFGNGGANAQEFFSIMETGLGTGVLGTDKAGDLFKEFVVRIQDGSSLTRDSLTALGLNADQVLSQLADGTIEPIDAFNLVQQALRNTDNEALLMQTGVGLLGTQFEDLGANAVLAVDTMSDSFADVSGATDSLNAKYANWGSMWEGIKRQALSALLPLGESLLGIANEAMPFVQQGFDWLKNELPPILERAGQLVDQVFGQVEAAAGPVIRAFGDEGISGAVRVALDQFGELRTGLLDKLKEALPGALDWLKGELERWGPVVAAEAGKLAVAVLEWIGPATRDMIIKLGELLGTLLTWIYDNREEIAATLSSWAAAFGEWAKTEGLPALGQALLDIAGGLWESIKDRWNAAFAPGTIGESLVNSIKESIAKSWEGFKQWFLDMLVSAIPGAGAVLQIANGGGVAIPGFATGVENFRGGLAYVHQGEVLTNLPAGTDVIPAGRAGGGGGGQTVIIEQLIVQGSVLTERDLLEGLRQGLVRIGQNNPSGALGGY